MVLWLDVFIEVPSQLNYLGRSPSAQQHICAELVCGGSDAIFLVRRPLKFSIQARELGRSSYN
jgi:hypothetical protein